MLNIIPIVAEFAAECRLEQFTMQGAHGEAMAILYIATIDLVRSDRQNFQRYIDHQLQNILEVVMRERDKAI